MAIVKITELPTVTPTGHARIPIVQSATTRQATITVIQNSIGIYAGFGVPSVTAADGSIFLRSDGTNVTTVYYRLNSAWIAQG